MSRRLAIGSAWVISARWLMRIAGLLNIAVLARVLTQSDFGLIAIILTISGLAMLVLDTLSYTPLLRLHKATPKHYGAALVLKITVGLLIASLLFVIGPYLQYAYEIDQFDQSLYLSTLLVMFYALASPNLLRFQRDMSFGKDFLFESLTAIIRVILSVSFALYYQSAYGVLIALVIAAFLRCGLSYLMTWSWPLSFSSAAAREILSITKWVSIETFASAGYGNFDRLILAKLTHASSLGVFAAALDLVLLPHQMIIMPISRALLPALQHVQSQTREKVKEIYAHTFGSILFLSIPICFGLGLVGDHLILTVLGDKWAEAIPVLYAALGYAFALSVFMPLHQILITEGELKLIAILDITKAMLYLLAVAYAFQVGGLLGVAFVKSLVGVLMLLPSYIIVQRLIKIKNSIWMWAAIRSLIATAVMIIGVLWIQSYALTITDVSLILLIGLSVFGGVVFATSALLIWLVVHKPAGLEQKVIEILSLKFMSLRLFRFLSRDKSV